MLTKSILNKNYLFCVTLFIALLMVTSPAQAGHLNDSVPMSPQSWNDVRSYMKNINYTYTPSPGIVFLHPQPHIVISEKTAVEVLDSVVHSLEEGGKSFEPWVFQHIDLLCGLHCDGT